LPKIEPMTERNADTIAENILGIATTPFTLILSEISYTPVLFSDSKTPGQAILLDLNSLFVP